MNNKEKINHPPHYNAHPSGIECIDIIEHMDFNIGNSIKYIWRSNHKENLIEDIKKSIWYISREIERRESFNIFQKLVNNIYSSVYKNSSKINDKLLLNIANGFTSAEICNVFILLYYSTIFKNTTWKLESAKNILENHLKFLERDF